MRLAAAVAALCLSAAGIAASPGADAAVRRLVDIPAQPLGAALEVFEKQRDLRVVFMFEDVRDVKTQGVSGDLTIEEALNRMLNGTGLTFQFMDSNTVSIVPVTNTTSPRAMTGSAAAIHLALAQAESNSNSGVVQGGNSSSQTHELEEVVVQALYFHDNEASTALKMPLSIKDTPQTVMAITRDMMDFAAIKSFQDVYKIDATGGTTHRLDNFTVNYYRGFRQQSNNAVKIDGFRLLVDSNLDFAPFERLEVVKGATSTLYGQNSIAGTLNIISKMPKEEFGGEVKVEGGSFDHYRGEIDLYGPLNSDRTLTYRLVGAKLDENSYLDYAGKNTTVIAPTVQYKFSDDTKIFLHVDYQDTGVTAVPAVPLQYFGNTATVGTLGYDESLLKVVNLPRSFYAGQDWGENQHKKVLLIHSGFQHHFDNDWTLRVNAQRNRQDLEFYNYLQHTGVIRPDGRALSSIIVRFQDVDWQLTAGEVNLYGDVELFGRKHTLFFGADYAENTDAHGPRLLAQRTGVVAPSLYDPAYHTLVAQPTSLSQYTTYNYVGSTAENSGFTAQAMIRPIDNLTVLLAGRYSKAETNSFVRVLTNAPVRSSTEDSKVTSQFGVTYALTPNLNLYASYGETFEVQAGLISPGVRIDPQEGVLKEIGLKGEIGRRFAYSLAVFDMERSNISQSNLASPGFVVPLGTQRSRGVELAAQGTVLPGWEIYGSLGVMDPEYIDGEFKGYQPENAPKMGLSLFTSYQLQDGVLRGLGFGAGVVHKRGRETFFTQRSTDGGRVEFDFGAYTEVDARVFYNLEHWRLQLSATNLLNEEYYSPNSNNVGSSVFVNPSRAVIGQVSYRF
ncbi:TonB-dependent siderophore receptor [Steroidobacter sp.]|uniref:TonB-dependent siderophore receptor n=1 Tax=Steroidobacter sp. TaxID=1978227 RepID=UPI001A3FCEB8|nr:TonB-dependent receptor [Steroidobacter sp.]MBL8267044.1 TonB-dependent receptor [Steroidobacter sp.]